MSGDQPDLDAIEARANAATPGPWHGSHEDYGQCVHVGDYGYVCSGPNAPDYDGGIGEQGRGDAEFIAHAREDVPALVAEVRRLRALLADREAVQVAAIAGLSLADIDEVGGFPK